ncbi:hypothetical protein WH95_16460 [Kiloniella litopenaei]|uniref:TonB-dependent receptor n=2 Tax=Kiloniella litopenaei TaxID=1549748 RepID=A0A0M2R8F5_9PROT|nr:hypothetical protein WH95_16460 [Kiloniella litopenaei]
MSTLSIERSYASDILLDEIVITATKRDQTIEEINSSIQVYDSEELEKSRIDSVKDLDRLDSSLQIRSRGNKAYSNISIRGLSSSDFYNPSVSIYVDGSPQDQAVFSQELLNLDHVEILKGPQGTLYGRNAQGGVINIITRKPDDEFRLESKLSIDGKEQYGQALVSGPLFEDKLFGEFSIKKSHESGELTATDISDNKVDDNQTKYFRGKLRYAEKDNPFEAELSLTHEDYKSHEEFYVNASDEKNREVTIVAQGGTKPELERKTTSASLDLSYNWDKIELQSITSFQDRGLERNIFGSELPETQTSYSEEIRIAFEPSDNLNGVAGIYAQRTNFERKPVSASGTNIGKHQIDSYAVFGEGTYSLTDKLDLTAGARFSYDLAEVNFEQTSPTNFNFNSEKSFTNISPKLAIGYDLLNNVRVYGLYSQGYKPGGFNKAVSSINDSIAYNSEISDNFEVGAKTSFFNNNLELNTAAYFIKTDDKQIYVGTQPFRVLKNVGTAESKGIELSARAYLGDNLTLLGSAHIGKSTFEDYNDPTATSDYSGNRVPYAPDQTYNLSADYLLPISSIPGELSIQAGGRYIGKTYFDEANTITQSGYMLFDASATWDVTENVSLKVFGENLTDKNYRVSAFDFGPGGTKSQLGEGRFLGLSLTSRF